MRVPLGFFLLAVTASVQGGPPMPRPTSFNVEDFGAKGDGQTDDTKAIQAAFDAAGKGGWSEQYPGSSYFISKPVVFFPSGKYLVSDTIQVGANVQGEGTAIVHQQEADRDIFSSTYCWRWQLSGLSFVGGRHHLHVGNPNIDQGRIIIERCAFHKAAGTAVNITVTADEETLGWLCVESGKPSVWRDVRGVMGQQPGSADERSPTAAP